MNVLFISQYYPQSIAKKCQDISKIGLNWAAHNLSKAIIRGFEVCQQDFHVINVAPMSSFPAFAKSPRVPGCEDDNVQSLPYINVAYYKRKDTYRKVVNALFSWCRKTEGKKIIFFYNFNYLNAIIPIKEAFPDVKAVLLVTDLPEYRVRENKFLSQINELISPEKKAREGERFNYVDGYVLLASKMRERLPMEGKPWLLMEGIYNDEAALDKCSKDPHKVLMYTGNLGARYGIRVLLDAFRLIEDSDYRLWVRGNGELTSLVKERAQQDSRILYLEQMSREELMKREQGATLLVNPVLSSQEFTQFFFPSKTLEYMASGTPTLVAKLSCIPSEYYEHLFFFEEESAEGLAAEICRICEMPEQERNDLGQKASAFILNKKSPKEQISRVIEFFDSL
ncbi:MAG: glycosyltransferase family 4 protein [Bacteroidaceae bacterium]|nr:glycosyltransferase family 4 protein [Bacteroidaceae bacterium]